MSSKPGTSWSRWQMPVMTDSLPEAPVPEAGVVTPAPASDPAAELEAMHEAARREGREQGLHEGRQAAKSELGLQSQRWQQLIGHLAQPLAAVDAQVEQELAALALAVARRVIGEELRATPALLLPVIHQALAELPSAHRQVRLHLHPEDAHLIAESLPELHEASWHLIEDDGIERGGCLLESGSSRIDATLAARLDEVLARLSEAGFSLVPEAQG